MKIRTNYLKAALIFFLFAAISTTKTSAQNGQFDTRFTVKNIVCDSSQVVINVQVRAHTIASNFLMGNANYRFEYNPLQIRNPRISSQETFSNQAPASDNNYTPQNLNGSSVGTTRGTVSLNTVYSGGVHGAKRVDTAWTTVSCIKFDIVQMMQCFDLTWHDNNTLPITSINEVIIISQNPFDYTLYNVAAGGLFTNINTCPSSICNPVINHAPVVNIAPQTVKRDSVLSVCITINDVDSANTHTVNVCKQPVNGRLGVLFLNNPTHQLCFNYLPNARFVGRDSICFKICDNGLPSLCTTVNVPITVTFKIDTPSVIITPITTDKDSTITKCFTITGLNTNDTLHSSICGTRNGTAIVTAINNSLCVTYRGNPNFVGSDTVCIILCNVYGVCRTINIPIVVNGCKDIEAPRIVCPENMKVNIFSEIINDPSHFLQRALMGDSCLTLKLFYNLPTATDDCSTPTVTQTNTLKNGASFPIGTTELVFEAVDKLGKITTCRTKIDIVTERLIIAAADTIYACKSSTTSILSREMGTGNYVWTGPNGFTSFSRQANITNVSASSLGIYHLIATNGTCRVKDSVRLVVINTPVLVNDVYQMANGQTSLNGSSVLLNDTILRGANYSVKLKGTVGLGNLMFNSDGKFTYISPVDFTKTTSFVYEVCYTDCPNNCQTATVLIKAASGQRQSDGATNVITPNGDGINETLIIENYDPTIDINSQIVIYNQWGDAIFRAAPYLNDWNGTYNKENLPDGTYYFIFLKTHDAAPIKDFVTVIR